MKRIRLPWHRGGAEAGDVLVCPKDHAVAIVIDRIEVGELNWARKFRFAVEEPQVGTFPSCPFCAEPLIDPQP